jgi:DNA (cytosine-5)-methyltransferase 1
MIKFLKKFSKKIAYYAGAGMMFLAVLQYKNWITKNREWFTTHRSVLSPWLITSRNNKYWTGAVRKLEWQAGTLLPTDSMSTVLWSFRGSGIRIKRPDYVPTIVAMNMTPIYGPERRYLTARELLRLQSFPDTFQYDEKHIHKQVGNAVNVEVIRRCASFLLH